MFGQPSLPYVGNAFLELLNFALPPFGIAVTDPDLRCEVVNPAFGRMVGIDTETAPGRPLADLMPGASPALAGDQIFLRGRKSLYCLAGPR